MVKALLQRVLSASVSVRGERLASISRGILVFIAIKPTDTTTQMDDLARKILKLRLWSSDVEPSSLSADLSSSTPAPEPPTSTTSASAEPEVKSWAKSVTDINGELLLVSQFTLLASTRKGNKPDFHAAASPVHAAGLYEHFVAKMKTLYPRVQEGMFQAMMEVSLVNDGPVTMEVEIDVPPKRTE